MQQQVQCTIKEETQTINHKSN